MKVPEKEVKNGYPTKNIVFFQSTGTSGYVNYPFVYFPTMGIELNWQNRGWIMKFKSSQDNKWIQSFCKIREGTLNPDKIKLLSKLADIKEEKKECVKFLHGFYCKFGY